MSQPRLIKVALVGCGNFGIKRAQALSQVSNAQLTSLYDIDLKAAQDLSLKHPAQIAKTLDELINKMDFDTAIVGVPNQFHAEVCVPLLQAHKNVLCEKPIAHTFIDAEKIADAARNSKGFFKMGANLRFFSVVEAASAIIKEHKYGRILKATGQIGHNGNLVRGKWNQNKEMSGGGALIDNGVHLLDLFSDLFGQLDAKEFMSSRSKGFGDVEDYARARLQSKSDVAVEVEASWSREQGYANFTVVMENADLKVDTSWNYILLQEKNQPEVKIEVPDNGMSAAKELHYFFECVRNNVLPTPSAKEALQTFKTIGQLYDLQNETS